jgi:hypothetical protein
MAGVGYCHDDCYPVHGTVFIGCLEISTSRGVLLKRVYFYTNAVPRILVYSEEHDEAVDVKLHPAADIDLFLVSIHVIL